MRLELVRCLDCANLLVVIDKKADLKGYVCEAQPKSSSALRFSEIHRDELSKRIHCNLFTLSISTRTLTHGKQIGDFLSIGQSQVEETEKCTRCGKPMKKMKRFWVCPNCRHIIPAEFLK